MLVILPALCFFLIFLNLLCRRRPGTDVRSVILSAAVIWGTALAGITEILSLFGLLTAEGLAVSWGTLAAIAGVLLARRTGGIVRPEVAMPGIAALVLALPIVVIVAGTGVSAAAGWPNQWDSMVYHLSRVDHWIQNRSVAFYPSHIVRQLYNPPGAEYAILHLSELGNDERWANAVQWLSMIGSLIGVSAIAQRLGATPRSQLFSALCAATIPMGILQASGTQNDYVVAFWLVCLAQAALSPPSASRTFRAGASLGLALLSKGTALIFAAPLLLLTLAAAGPRWRARLIHTASILLIALVLNAAHWTRNIETFGRPLGPRNPGSADGISDKLTNDAMSPAILASNIVRNLSLHAGTPSRKLNLTLEDAVERGHTWLGVDVADPRSTRLYSAPSFAIVREPVNPDRAGNPVHVVLILLAAARIASVRQLRRSSNVVRYGLALAAGALLFCLVLKWQPWHSRLQLPLFVLAAPLVGAAWGASAWLMWPAAVVLSALAAKPLLQNRLAPLVGAHTVLDTPRMHQHFQSFSRVPSRRERGYLAAAALLRTRQCADVGLLLGWDDWEHPLWVLLADQPGGSGRIEHVGVTNGSARLSALRPPFAPCAIVVSGVPVADSIGLDGRTYRRVASGDGPSVFLVDTLTPAGREN